MKREKIMQGGSPKRGNFFALKHGIESLMFSIFKDHRKKKSKSREKMRAIFGEFLYFTNVKQLLSFLSSSETKQQLK